MAKVLAKDWIGYFAANREKRMAIPWNAGRELSFAERETILSSLQQFQLGESSEGKRLIELAQEYAEKSGDWDYLGALRLFIKEEQTHAADLGRFMDEQGLAKLEAHPVDGIFRFLRRSMNLELAIIVLLSAEIVTISYYKALHDATESPSLRTICRQILKDEIQHLNFQTTTLGKLRRNRASFLLWLGHQAERLFFAGTLLVVWMGHAKAYQAGGFSFGKFFRANWGRFEHTLKL
jgi:hypothetical protein